MTISAPRSPVVWRKPLPLLLLALPPLWIGYLISVYSVDIPYWDQWDGVCPLFERMSDKTLHLSNFFALHSEHRIFFPRLIMFGLAQLTHWNIRAELFGIWLLMGVCMINFWRLSGITGWASASDRAWLFVALSVLLFTPTQYETWLMGMQFVFLLPIVSVTACLWLAALNHRPARFLGTMIFGTISTFSMAAGLLCWVLTFPLLLLRTGKVRWREDRSWWIAWLAVFVIEIALYFHGYHKPEYHPSVLLVFDHPGEALAYCLAYLGAPFGLGTALPLALVCVAMGGMLVATLGVCVIYLWRWRRDEQLVSRALPWLVPPVFALANAMMTTVGRMGFGIGQALSSRYIAFAIMLPAGLVFLVPMVFEHWRTREPVPGQTRALVMGAAGVALAAMLGTMHQLSAFQSITGWIDLKRTRLIDKALVECINVVDEPAELHKYVHANVPPLRDRVNLLDRLGWLRPGPVRSKSIKAIAGVLPEGSVPGVIEQGGTTADGQVGLNGWAILPGKNRPADAILITYDDADGEAVIFALAITSTARQDVAATLNNGAYIGSGWTKVFNPGLLPPGKTVMKAWSFDAETGLAYPLQGQATFDTSGNS